VYHARQPALVHWEVVPPSQIDISQLHSDKLRVLIIVRWKKGDALHESTWKFRNRQGSSTLKLDLEKSPTEPSSSRNQQDSANNMRMQRAVRAAASAEASISSLRSCASRPRFLCLNAQNRGLGAGAARSRETQRYFSQSTIVRAGTAEAV
jgi:hypothetical protein